MSEIQIAIWAAIGFFVWLKILEMIDNWNWWKGWWKGWNWPWNWWEIEKQVNHNAKIYKKIDKENLALENLHIQREELENEIDRLEIESSTDFEKEASNNTRTKKLRLKIKHIDINIENKYNNVDNLNRDLKWMY